MDAVHRLIAYVCEGGVVHETTLHGVVYFYQIVLRNDHNCRYAVTVSAGEYRAYDLNQVTFDNRFRAVDAPFKVYPGEDAAVVACAMLNHRS